MELAEGIEPPANRLRKIKFVSALGKPYCIRRQVINSAMAPVPEPFGVGPARSYFSFDNLRGQNRPKTYIVPPVR
jgi:hypothetical protein